MVPFLLQLYGTDNTQHLHNNWPWNLVQATTNTSFFELTDLMVERIHMTTLCALCTLDRATRCWTVFCLLFFLLVDFITEKSFRVKWMWMLTSTVFPPHILSICFLDIRFIVCTANLFYVVVQFSFQFTSSVCSGVFIFQENPIENCAIASFQFVSNHHCTLVWSSAKRKWAKDIWKGQYQFQCVQTV